MSGFENFQVNSFEQLCINVANEHLQFYFNEHIFLQEEEEYFIEGLAFETINFQNNEDLIELFMGVCEFFCTKKTIINLFLNRIATRTIRFIR